MADGGQRLLDVIDDPNALESFLGGLTADAELLPSETVDNVVASLARSLDENDYEVDSPNETLFDTLDSSSNHLTDISRSYVPSDFGHVAVQNDVFTNNLDGFSSPNGNNSITIRGNLQHHQQTSEHHQISVLESSGCDQFLASSCSTNNNNSTLINSVISAPSISNSTNVTAATNSLKLISASVSNNCDPSKTITNFVQSGQIHLSQNSVSSAPNSLNFTFSQDLQQQQHNKNISVTQNQLNQVASLSSVSVEGQNSTNNLISVVASANENGVVSTLSNNLSSSNFQIVTNQQSGQAQKAHNVSTHNTSATSSSVSITSNDTVTNNVTLSTSTNVVGTATIQPTPQQFVASSSAQQTTASVNQLISGQTVSIPNMTVSASQLIANSQGQNLLQQIQSAAAASAGQSYITMEQPTALIATGPTTFGTNVALVATGGTPAYAVLPTTPQFLTNAIIPQSHTIQTLAKAANGTYFQTAGTPQLVATSNVGALQNVSSTTVTTSSVTTPPVTSVSSSTESTVSSGAGTQQQTSLPASSSAATDGVVTQLIQQSQQQITSVSGATGTVAITPQQSFAIGNTASLGQVVVSQVNSLSTMTAPQQTQLAGTIVVNQYGQPMLLPTASTAQAGGLQLILRQQPTQPQVLTIQAPTGAATAQTAGAAGKPIVRYVSQVPQVAQTSGYGLQQIQTANGPAWVAVRYPAASQASQFGQLQGDSIVTTNQITASGQPQIQIQASQLQLQQQQTQQLLQQQAQQSQIQVQSGLTTQTTLQTQQGAAQLQIQAQQQQQQLSLQTQTQPQSPQVQLAGQQLQQQQGQPQGLQQVQLSQGPISMEAQNAPTQQNQHFMLNRSNQSPMLNQATPQQLTREVEQQQISVPDSSSEPPPPKKAKTKSKSSKKKVTLDLEQLLKQSGIMDEDLNDDMSFDFGFGSSMDTQLNGLPASPQIPPAQIPVINTTETPKKSSSKKKSNAKKSPAQPPPPPVPPPPVATPSPSAKPAKKRSPPKKKNAAAVATPTPPPPPVLPPPPPPVTTTPKKSRSGGGSKKKSGTSSGNASNEKPKSEPTKTASSKKTAPPKKISSLDTLLATIDAVAAAAGRSSPMQVTPPPPPTPPPPSTTPSRSSNKSSPSPKKKSGGSKSKSKKSTPAAPTPVKVETVPPPPPPVISSTKIPPPVSISATSTLPSPSLLPPPPSIALSQPQPTSIANPSLMTAPMSNLLTSTAASLLPPSINSAIPAPRVTGPPNLTNGCTSVTTSQTGLTRVVQTIQLTPQNQQLLQNIHSQIQRLLALPKRSETEQQALHKLQVLQQQVIATGIPVPNPAHLNNLAQSVNVEAISVATPSATVPSFDTATATASSSTANAPFLFPPESDTYVNPVSSTVVTTAAVLSGLASINNSLTLAKLNSSNSGASPHHGSPSVVTPSSVTATGAAVAGGGSSNNNGASGIVLGSPSVSSTASPDSTSNIANSNNLTLDLCSTDTASPNVINSGGGVGNLPVVVSNVKTDLGHLVTSVSAGASSEEKNKENTHGKGAQSQGMATMSTAVPVSLSTSSSTSVSFSQHLHHVPSTTSFVPSTFSTRSVVDEKKAEEQRLANLKAEEEKRARWKKEEFDMLLQRDQQYVVKPDYEVPFATKKDAVERLMKYHIYRDRNDMDFEEFDAEFDNNSGILLEKFSIMMSKYRNLLLKESTKEVGCAERVMLERMFVSEEKVRLEQDRLSVAQGEILELPHPPESWLPKIKEMVDKEMMEFEPQDPVVSQQVQSAVDSIIGCESNDNSNYMLEEGDKIEYDAFGVPITSSGYAGLSSASSADIDEAVRSILS